MYAFIALIASPSFALSRAVALGLVRSSWSTYIYSSPLSDRQQA